MIDIKKRDWCSVVRLLARKDIHPMMHYHYTATMKKLSRPDKLRSRNIVKEYKEPFEAENPIEYYSRLYPVILIIADKLSLKYTGIINEIPALTDRHTISLDSTATSNALLVNSVWKVFESLKIPMAGVIKNREHADERVFKQVVREKYLQLLNVKQEV